MGIAFVLYFPRIYKLDVLVMSYCTSRNLRSYVEWTLWEWVSLTVMQGVQP